MDFAMAATTSRWVFTLPEATPYTTPGIRNVMKMMGTIDCINGAAETSSARRPSSPGGAAQGVSAGSMVSRNATTASAPASPPHSSPRRSCGASGSCVGSSAGSASTRVARSRGSITRSVSTQPTTMTRAAETVVNTKLLSGFTTTDGSTSCAAVCERPESNGSRPEGTPSVALNPPDTPAKAAAMPASGWRPAA